MIDTGQKIKRLIIDECACYSPSLNSIKHYCDREQDEDCCCRLFKDQRCGYFEKAVLPMNPQLKEIYQAELKANAQGYEITEDYKQDIIEKKSSIKGLIKIHCKKCGKIFLAKNYRQQYCDFCKKFLRRERNRNAMSTSRSVQLAL